jgi:hypothetical protein
MLEANLSDREPGFPPEICRSCTSGELSPPRLSLLLHWILDDRCVSAPQGLISGSVQIFFAWRIKVLSMSLIVFAAIAVLTIPQFGTLVVLGCPNRPGRGTLTRDPDVRPSFRSRWNRIYNLNRQGRQLYGLEQVQQRDRRMDRHFDGL